MRKSVALVVFLLLFSVIPNNTKSASHLETQIDTRWFKQTWSGQNLPINSISAAPRELYIIDQENWKKIWQKWRGSEKLPKVNFRKQLIVFCTTISPNHCSINISLDKKGNLKLNGITTLIGSDGTKFNYKMALIDRAGIKTINGKPI